MNSIASPYELMLIAEVVNDLLAARVRNQSPLCAVVRKQASPAIAVFVPEPGFGVFLQRGSRDQEAIAAVGVNGCHGVILDPKHGL